MVIQIAAFFVMPNVAGVWILAALVFLVITCYGGGFACLPAYLSDLFGTKEVSAIHGYAITAWGFAGVAGPQLASFVLESTGNYTSALYVVNVALVIGLVTVAVLRWRIGKLQDTNRTQGAADTATD